MSYAFCTLLTSDSYLPGVLTLAHALKALHPTASHPVPYKLVCLVTPETLSERSLKLAAEVWDFVVGVEVLEWEGQEGNLGLLGRQDLALVLTKLHVFRLTEFSKVLFLDADTLPLKPLSHLFALPSEFSAAPDTGWPDCFNSGVMVLTPKDSTFDGLRHMMNEEGSSGGSFDGGDQGILNQYFNGEDGRPAWNRISFTYNVTPTAAYTYAPAYKHYGSQISAIHFIGRLKPWSSPSSDAAPHSAENSFNDPAKPFDYHSLVGRWWSVYNRWVAPRLRVDGGMVGEGKLKRLEGGLFGREGGFVGLPLDGREDLVQPSKRPPPPPVEEVAPPPSSEPEPFPQELQEGVPYFLPWDPATQDPPKSGIQMSGAFPVTDYANEWSHHGGAKDWVPDVPENLRGGRGEREDVQASVFPWESRPRPTPSRVFPGEVKPPSQSTEHSKKTKRESPPVSPPAQLSRPSGYKPSFAEAMAGPSSNAWDSDPAIQAYASRLTSPPSVASQLPAVGSTRRRSDSNRSREPSRDGGADGDDEESTEASDDDEEVGPEEVVRHYRGNGGRGGGSGGASGGDGRLSAGAGAGHGQSSSHTSTGSNGNGGQQSSSSTQHYHTHAHGSSLNAAHHQADWTSSRAVQAAPNLTHTGTQYSPVARSTPLPTHPRPPHPHNVLSGTSTPALSSAAASAEHSTVHTPTRKDDAAAGAREAFNTHFDFDMSKKAAAGAKKVGGRSWDPDREIDTFRDANRRFLGARQ